ncbi:3-ketosteroid-9-alpha-monooxygenase, ferredoxin reductase component [Neolewinella maritima]|uniref:3-ketosteroid-9-alpha-monooxygenase, ferredoxin reductase component n=1 Tax=Neolewinella maritima TaxID=1383882 RepID=A0ABM9B320_9BACT|nr:FAD-binding oxidoreductase [Neolewinella maritima]CAH1001591.1 3-ketosteroid-9-alpha-monooxygenase, ferredoxin reductase component [Neolewinella maritima]
MSKWKEAVITRIADRSPSVRSFWLALPDRERLEYRPGQFLTLDLPISENRRERWRSYSIAAAPDGTNEAELCIVQLPDGRGTRYLFEEAEVGTRVLTKEPGGVFTLPERPLDYDVVMICTGTGVAPFRAMLQERLGRETRRFHLIFGCRTAEDLLYREEFEALARKHPHFSYTATVSRERVEGTAELEVLSGYVHQVYQRDYATPRPDLRFYLCGWSQMVDEAAANLLALGYAKEQVILELYG